MQYTELYKIPGMLLLVDFEKAFDSVSWNFIQHTLELFNFKASIKQWIKVFYNNSESRIMQNGFLSESFKLERGCRQGDPLSPYIFIICAEVLAILIRNSKEIKGINIEGEEYVVSQYADDTTFILDGSPESLDSTLRILDQYANVSGLKINYSKTNIIWIGSKKFSKEVFHHVKWKLTWGETLFNLLGVQFSVNLEEIIVNNFEQKILEMKKLTKHWLSRKLTVLGRITVVKTLIISKITHLLISLPNPPDTITKQINKLLYNFIWQNKPEKIKREILIQDYNKGGIKMLHFSNFMMALKASWIKRLLTSDSKWVTLFQAVTKLKTEDMFKFGDNFIQRKQKLIKNIFWKNVLQSWIKIQQKQTWENNDEIMGTNIWLNSYIIKDHKPILYKHYVEKHIIFIQDLLNENGEFMNFETCKLKYSIKSNFLEYATLIKAIKTFIDNINIDNQKFVPMNNPIFPFNFRIFLKDKKGSKAIYKLLNKNNAVPTSQIKYFKLGYNFSAQKWKKYYSLPFRVLKDSSLLWFQYKILHRILTTNSFLYKIKYIDTDICNFCNAHPETLDHLFYECVKVNNVWKTVELWTQTIGTHIIFDKNTVLFGTTEFKDIFFNWLIINVKYYIYRMKIQNAKLSTEALKIILNDKLQIEKYIFYKNCLFKEFDETWGPWLTFFDEN